MTSGCFLCIGKRGIAKHAVLQNIDNLCQGRKGDVGSYVVICLVVGKVFGIKCDIRHFKDGNKEAEGWKIGAVNLRTDPPSTAK